MFVTLKTGQSWILYFCELFLFHSDQDRQILSLDWGNRVEYFVAHEKQT